MSRSYQPSNGTEGDLFTAAWCAECERERRHRETDNPYHGCRILTRALAFESSDPNYPREWTYDAEGNPTCTAYEPELSAEERRARAWTAAHRAREDAGQARLGDW